MSLFNGLLETVKVGAKISEAIISGTCDTVKDCKDVLVKEYKENPIKLTEQNKADIAEIKDSWNKIKNNFKK